MSSTVHQCVEQGIGVSNFSWTSTRSPEHTPSLRLWPYVHYI